MFSTFATRRFLQSASKRFSSSAARPGSEGKYFSLLAGGVGVSSFFVYGTILNGTKTNPSAGILTAYHAKAR